MIELLLNGFSRERIYLSENIILQDEKGIGGGVLTITPKKSKKKIVFCLNFDFQSEISKFVS